MGSLDSVRGSGGGSSGGSSLSSVRGDTVKGWFEGAASRQRSQLRASTKRTRRSGGWLTTPAKIVLRAVGVSGYSVGNLIRNPKGELLAPFTERPKLFGPRSAVGTFRDERRHVLPSDALEERGVNYPGGALGFVLRLGTDVALDPATWGTLGGAAALTGGAKVGGRVALRSAGREAALMNRTVASQIRHRQLAMGRPLTMGEQAPFLARASRARAETPRALTIGVRVPFSRNRSIPLGEFRGPGQTVDLAEKAAAKITPQFIRNYLKTNFVSTRGASKARREVFQQLRRMSEAERGNFIRRAQVLNREIRKREKELGFGRGQLSRAISFHLDNPAKHEVPEGAFDLAQKSRGMLDEIHEVENISGIIKGEVGNYVPHVLANQKSLRAYRSRREHAAGASRADNPFFIKTREVDTLDELVALGKAEGWDVELNIAELIAKRASASVNARLKKAVDDGIFAEYGVKPPRELVPDVAKAERRLAEDQARLEELAAPRDTSRTRASLDEVTDEVRRRKVLVQAAQRTGDPVKVAAARKALADSQKRAEVIRAASWEVAFPRLEAMMASLPATGARLPKPTGGRIRQGATEASHRKSVEAVAANLRAEAQKILADFDLMASRKQPQSGPMKVLRDEARLRAKGAKERAKNRRKGSGRPDIRKEYGEGQSYTGYEGEMLRFHQNRSTNWLPHNPETRVMTGEGKHGSRAKRYDDWTREIVQEVDDAIARDGEAAARELIGDEIVDAALAVRAAEESESLARMIDEAVFSKFNPEDIAADPAMAARYDQLAERYGGKTSMVDNPARRKRAAKRSIEALNEAGVKMPGQPEVAMNVATTPGGRRAAERYFESGPIPESGISRNIAEIEDEIDEIERLAERGVTRAEKDLAKAEKSKSEPVIRAAREALRRAETNRRRLRLALEREGAQYVGAPRNLIAQTKRVQKSERRAQKTRRQAQQAIEHNRLLDQRPGAMVDGDEYADLMKTWEEIAESKRYHDGSLLPPDVAEDLRRIHDTLAPKLRPDGLEDAARFINNVSGRWKGLALATPGFHLRNMQDDMLRAYWAGARNPKSFIDAYRALRWTDVNKTGRRGVKGTQGGTIRIKKGPMAGSYSYDEFVELAEQYGIIRTGFIASEVKAGGDVGARRLRGPGQGPLVRFSADVGQYREDMTRAGLFLELLKRGDDPLEAARLTRQYLFDYGEVSQFIAGTRRLIMPFITFPSKAIPQTIRTFATRPGIPANLNKLAEHSYAAAGAPDLSSLQISSGTRFAVPRQAIPAPLRNPLGLGNPDEPPLFNAKSVTGFASLDLLDPRIDPFRKNVLAGLVSPLVRVPGEQAFGKEVYTYKDFPQSGARAPFLVQQAARIPGVAPLIGYKSASHPDAKRDWFTGKAVASYNARLNNIVRSLPFVSQVDQATGQSSSSRNSQARYFGGFSVSPFDKARAEAQQEKFG